MTDRSYQSYAEAELLQLKSRHESSMKHVEREKRDYERRVGSGYYRADGYKELEAEDTLIWKELSAINRELTARHGERA